MNNQQNRERWARELEESLGQAVRAEAQGRHGSADWLLQKAVFLEGQLRGVADPRAYVYTAGPVYEGVSRRRLWYLQVLIR